MAFVERTGNANPFNQVITPGGSKPTFADIDNDSDKDLIVGHEQGGFSYYRNDGNGQYTQLDGVGVNPVHNIYTTGSLSAIAFADLDNDGDVDAVVGSSNGRLDYFRNDGTSNGIMQWTRTEANSPFRNYNQTKPVDVQYSTPTFADLDGDGDLDAVVGSEAQGVLFLRNNGGTFDRVDGAANPFHQFNLDNTDTSGTLIPLSTPTFGDFDGDGDLDAAVGNALGTIAYLQNNNGVLTQVDYTSNPFRAWNDLANQNAEQDLSAPTFRDVDGDGDLDAVIGVVDGRLRYLENTGNTNPPPVGTIIEANGTAKLISSNAGYQVQVGNNTPILIRYDGTPVTPNTYPGWQMIAAEAKAGGGFQVVWRGSNGEYSLAQLDANGNRVSGGLISIPDLIALEPTFQQDLNNDGQVGNGGGNNPPPVGTPIESNGTTTLVSSTAGYQLQVGNNTPILIRYDGTPVTPNTYPGWQMIAAETKAGGGFQVVWRGSNGEYSLAQLDANGNRVSGGLISIPDLIALEPTFQQDLNNDGQVGNGGGNNPPPVGTPIESNGTTTLLSSTAGYQLQVGNNTPILIRYDGTPVTPNTYPGWQMIAAEAKAGGGFQVVWRGSNGEYSLAQLDANGNRVSGGLISIPDLIALEPTFQQDLNGDGQTGQPNPGNQAPSQLAFSVGQHYNLGATMGIIGYAVDPNGFADIDRVDFRLVNAQGVETDIPDALTFGQGTGAGGENIAAFTYQYSLAGLAAGTYTIRGEAWDKAGNRSQVVDRVFNISGNPPTPPEGTIIEANGNVTLLNTATGYKVLPLGDQTPTQVVYNGSNLTETSLTAWNLLAAEFGDNGYELVMKSKTTAGRYQSWTLDGDGVYQSFRILSEAEVMAKEPGFFQDLNGDGQVGSTIVNATGTDSLVGNTILVGGEASTFMATSGQDQFVFSDWSSHGKTIVDFSPSQDQLVFSNLFTSLGYAGNDPIADGYLQLLQLGAETQVQVDIDGKMGSASLAILTTLNNVTSTSLAVGISVLI